MKLLTTTLLLLISTTSIAGSYSTQSKIGLVQFDANADKIYIKPNSGTWVNGGACPDVYMTSNRPGYKTFVSMVLAAKLAGKEVKFFGDCNTSTNQFDAHSIYIP